MTSSHRTVAIRTLSLFAGIVSLGGAVACENVSGNADSVLSIRFDSLAAPAVVIGDTLRDTTGAVRLPSVHAFNSKGEEIPSAPVWFQSPDSGVQVDSATGIVVGDSLRSTPARIIATVAGLQAIQRIDVTLRPDFLFAEHALDSVAFSLIDSTQNLSPTLSVRLAHGTAPNDSAVKSYIVSFSIISPSDPQLAVLVNDAGKPSAVDTTDASGIAGRRIRLHPQFLSADAQVDSVIVNASARYRGVLVSGSPVRLVLNFKPR
jgi:hypothetical protein